MALLNFSFLTFRIILRRRQTEGLRLSDLLILNAFLLILSCTSMITWGNGEEIKFIKKHPGGQLDPSTGLPNPGLDPVVFGFPEGLQSLYGQVVERSFLSLPFGGEEVVDCDF